MRFECAKTPKIRALTLPWKNDSLPTVLAARRIGVFSIGGCDVSDRSRANLAHIRQSRPASGLRFEVTVPKTLQGLPSSLGIGYRSFCVFISYGTSREQRRCEAFSESTFELPVRQLCRKSPFGPTFISRRRVQRRQQRRNALDFRHEK